MSNKLPFFDRRRKNNKSLHATINKLMKKKGTKKNVMSFGNIKSKFSRYKQKQSMKKLKSRQSKKLKLQSKYRRRNNKSTRKLFNSMRRSRNKMISNYTKARKRANKQWRIKHAKKIKTMKKYGRHSVGSVKSWSAYNKKYGNDSGRTKKKKSKKR